MYRVVVEDKRGRRPPYSLGQFDFLAWALAAARRLIVASLSETYQPGMSADELFRAYRRFGPRLFILCRDRRWRFATNHYARGQSARLCGSRTSAPLTGEQGAMCAGER